MTDPADVLLKKFVGMDGITGPREEGVPNEVLSAIRELLDEVERLRSALELIADGLPTMDGRDNIDSKRFAAGVLERGDFGADD